MLLKASFSYKALEAIVKLQEAQTSLTGAQDEGTEQPGGNGSLRTEQLVFGNP